MVLYTVNSLLVPNKRAIIGLTSGDCTYGIVDILCNNKYPTVAASSELVNYAPEPASLLRQCACIEHLQHGLMQDKFYTEIILSENAAAIEQVEIDINAGAWEPTQESLLAAWMEYMDKGLEGKEPYAYVNHRGEAEALVDYYKKVAASEQNIIITSSMESYTIVSGLKYNGTLYGAYDILTNSNVRKKLTELLGYTPAGCITTQGETISAYAIVDTSSTTTLCIPTTDIKGVVDIESLNAEYAQGFNPMSFVDSNHNTSLAKFKQLYGDPQGIEAYRNLHSPRIYTIATDDTTAFFAACIDGTYISLNDVCRLQAAYEKVASAMEVSDMPCQVSSGLKLTLLLTEEMLSNTNVVFRSCTILEQNSGDIFAKLMEDFSSVTNKGLAVEDLTSKITLPQIRTSTLTHFKMLRGDFAAIEEYNNAYSKLYPSLTSVVQDDPTALLSRALPTYQQLVEIYNSDETDSDDVTESSTSEGETNYFVDALTGVADEHIGLVDYSQLDMNINLRYMPLTKIFSYYDCVHYKNAIAATGLNVDPTLIEGNANNNTLSIQENELKMYAGLRNLVVYGICVENDIYTVDDLEASLCTGTQSRYVNAFLRDLADDAYTLNWVHTGHVLSKDTDEDDNASEDGDDSISMSIPGRYYVEVGVSETGQRQERKVYEKFGETEFLDSKSRLAGFQAGMPRIDAYAQLEVKNPFTWIEIVIRLLRWGARKPNSLYVPSLSEQEHGPRFLNMQTLIVSGFSGTFTNLTKRTYGEENATYLVDSAINFEVSESWASDISELNSNLSTHLAEGDIIPCGVSLASTFVNLAGKTQYFYVDVFTLASQLSKGQIKVYGINYDEATSEFICSSDAKAITGTSGEDEIYTPENCYERTSTLWSVLDNLNIDSVVHTQSKCAFLVKYLRVMDEKLSNFKINSVSIFDLIKLCATPLRWDCIAECEQLFNISNNDERRDKASQIRVAYQLSSMDEIMTWMIFAEAVRPFLLLAEYMRDKPKTLAQILKGALVVQAQIDSLASSARSMQADSGAISFDSYMSKCVKYYQFTHPMTNEVVCYAGIADSSSNSKIVICTASEVTKLPEVSFETRALPVFYKEWIIPIIPYYKAVAAQPKDMSARQQYQAQLNARFIQATPQTFSSILKTCIEISKQQKAQRA